MTHHQSNPSSTDPAWLSSLVEALKNNPGARLKGLQGGAGPFALSLLAGEFPLAVLPTGPRDMAKWVRGLSAWLGSGDTGDFPARVHPIPPRTEPRLPPPHSDDAGDPVRFGSLAALESNSNGKGRNNIFIIPPATLLQRIPLGGAARTILNPDMELDRDEFIAGLMAGGYRPATTVYERGEFRLSGEIVDVYPPRGAPVRIEFEFDRVASLRSFDPASQRSTDSMLQKAVLDPVSEAPLDETHRLLAVERMKASRFDSSGDEGREVIERLKTGALETEDADRYMVWFARRSGSILDRLPADTVIVTPDGAGLSELLETLWEGIHNEHWNHPDKRILPAPEETYFSPEQIVEQMEGMSRLELGGPASSDEGEWPVMTASATSNEDIRDEIRAALGGQEGDGGLLTPLVKRVNNWLGENMRVALSCLDGVGAARLESLLAEYGIETVVDDAPGGLLEGGPPPGETGIYISPLAEGFRMPGSGWAVVTEEEIFGAKVRVRPARRLPSEEDIQSFQPDKPVVHIDHGIGMFRNTEKLTLGGFSGDYLKIEYADAAILYVPVYRMSMVEPYRSDTDDVPELDKLGGKAWAKSLSKARKAIEEIAKELVELYAARKVFDGYAFPPSDGTFRELEASFPYEETPDQAAAIEDVINDMEKPRPMDRIICGDVGYGKTEVAMRAAFKSAMDGKQVALLVPTTLLAYQHNRTFSERLKPYPLVVDMLSRFRTPKQQRETVKGLREGRVDIVIGTHRLLQKDIEFRDLGLIIIDEEHRFGVKHKERLKQMRKTVDALSLTATPIPRTLQMSLLSLWDMSIMDTPPPDRLAVRTRVMSFNEDLIRDAIIREMDRGGQVFFVHNLIKGIEGVERMIKDLAPNARVGVGHGQMEEKKLEKVMMEFMNGDLDVLLSTSIIESGLDIPRANTIIINRAHTFGLASLYQLRGRVGRSSERGYAYLLIPGKRLITKSARDRLRALEEFSELGSGYRLARMDLKLRGAGNILGEVQSGHIHRVGFDMYLGMLDRAIKEIRGEPTTEEIDPEIQLNVPAFLPEDYIRDPDSRILFYRRLAKTRDTEEITALKGELLDRFGPLPEPAETLLHIISLKNVLRPWRVKSLRKEGRAYRLSFSPDAPIDPVKVIETMNARPRQFRVAPDNQLLFIPLRDGLNALVPEFNALLKEIVVDDTIT